MKTLKALLFIASLFASTFLFAQTKKESFTVAGECGMCKKKIESAATKAGATQAVWNSDTKLLTVSYKTATTSRDKIEKGIAAVGYDTPSEKTSQEVYDKLDDCCKYDRSTDSTSNKPVAPIKKSSH